MRIRYDPEADAMYIRFKSGPVDHTKELDENTIVDFDSSGKVIGVELLFVKERNPALLKELHVENVISG
jgi:uncharacterized protein YuzE